MSFQTVPEDLLTNVSHTVEQPRRVPKRLDEYSKEEVEKFPKLWELPEEYAIK